MAHLGAHLAFRSRWQKTDDELCRHSMSFILHKAIRNDFFQSYLYLLEKIPLGKWVRATRPGTRKDWRDCVRCGTSGRAERTRTCFRYEEPTTHISGFQCVSGILYGGCKDSGVPGRSGLYFGTSMHPQPVTCFSGGWLTECQAYTNSSLEVWKDMFNTCKNGKMSKLGNSKMQVLRQ